jgi:hypothetical protein
LIVKKQKIRSEDEYKVRTVILNNYGSRLCILHTLRRGIFEVAVSSMVNLLIAIGRFFTSDSSRTSREIAFVLVSSATDSLPDNIPIKDMRTIDVQIKSLTGDTNFDWDVVAP